MKFGLVLIILLLAACSENIQENILNEELNDEQERIIEDTNTQEINEEVAEELPELDACSNLLPFQYPPVNLEKTKVMVPFGLMSGNHVTPVDHQYFQDFSNTEADIEVYSPAEGTILDIQHMSGMHGDLEFNDYRIIIDHGCNLESIFIHIDKLIPEIKSLAPPPGEYKRINYEVKAGQIIGYYSQNVDYNIADYDFELEGFVIPEHYEDEVWKIHVPNTLEYFSPEISDKMSALCLSFTEEKCGKFDHDIDGTLQGNWFLEGTKDYGGLSWDGYWKGHLSISPNYLDYDQFIFSIGDYEGREEQFGIDINPSEINPDSGIVKFELYDYEYYTDGRIWEREELAKNIKARNGHFVHGTVLAQMLDDRTLKLELFPNKKASEVDSFNENHRVYNR